MRKLLLATAMLGALVGYNGAASADTVTFGDDPLHFTCSNCGTTTGTFIPVTGVTPSNLQVDEDGTPGSLSATDFILKVLIPITGANLPGTTTDTLSGRVGSNLNFSDSVNLTAGGTGGLFANSFFWLNTQGNTSLETDFLGITLAGGSPPNRINTFLGPTDAAVPGVDGFVVLTLDLGPLIIGANNFANSPFDLSFLNALPVGSWVLGDAILGNCAISCTDVTTATSEALFINQLSTVPGPIVGAGIPGIIAAFSMIGLGWRRRRKALGVG